MSEPTRPGYYWAKHTRSPEWEIVYVNGTDGTFRVETFGPEDWTWPLSDFTFGPEVTKPEGLD
jgi:hypothetical protein